MERRYAKVTKGKNSLPIDNYFSSYFYHAIQVGSMMIAIREEGTPQVGSFQWKFDEACQSLGIPLYYLPIDFRFTGNAPVLPPDLPRATTPELCLLAGYVMRPGHYDVIHDLLAAKGYTMLNTPIEHQQCLYFDKAYPLLRGITPKSIACYSDEEAKKAAKKIGYPVFVKGLVQSLKNRGTSGCFAHYPGELGSIVMPLLHDNGFSSVLGSGGVVIREKVKLRYEKHNAYGFPQGREFRIFLLDNTVLDCVYYWEVPDSLSSLTDKEQVEVTKLAELAGQRFLGRFLSIDIGQLDDGSWIVIEVGDAQFAGIPKHISLEQYTSMLKTIQCCPVALINKIRDLDDTSFEIE